MKEAKEHPAAVKLTHHIHWIAMIVLGVSGYYIHSPWSGFEMNSMRYIHFIAMYVLLFAWLFRIYYLFFGKDADMRDFLPEKENRGKLIPMIAYYTFFRKTHPGTGRYNPLQKTTYICWFFLLIIQGITGFALYVPSYPLFSWVITLLGGLRMVRLVHYLILWLFIITIAIHVYLTFAEDLESFKVMFLGKKEES